MAEDDQDAMSPQQAVDLLWGWMPAEQVKEIRSDFPDLAEYCMANHHDIWHNEHRPCKCPMTDTAKIVMLRDALHLAFDWMGRDSADSWDLAHLEHALGVVRAALAS